MSIRTGKLTVFFEEPFWVGIYERECDGKYEVCKFCNSTIKAITEKDMHYII